uniref:Uncharacterized protein n=1 Tax=Plectus sambesii TaxID=2011161 RepID=A0A914X9V5_9BILA
MLDGVGMVCSRPEHCRFCQTAVAEITISLDCSTFEVRDVDNRPYEHDPFAPLPDCKSPSTGTASCTSSAREILSTRRFAYFFWIARIVSIGAFIWFRSYPNNAANPANPADAADAANPNPNSNANGRVQPHEEENGIEMQGAQDVNPRQATDTPTARNDSERRVSTSSDDDDFRSATDATAAANDSGRGTSTFSDEDDSRSDITSTAAGDVSELAHASSAAGDEEFSEPMCPIL